MLLPELEEFKPSGTPEGPLATAKRLARHDGRDGQARAPRDEHDAAVGGLVLVLPALSSIPRTTSRLVDPELERYWMPVDLYVGGAEHAVLHLLYARFWHKVLYDAGLVSTPEPFQKLVHQGMILGELELTQYRAANASSCPRSTCVTARMCGADRSSRPNAWRGRRREARRAIRAAARNPASSSTRAPSR